MPYVITNGAVYLKTGNNNRPSTTATIESAKSFDTKIKAQNMCACLPNNFKKMGFYVIAYGEQDVIPEVTTEMQAHPSSSVSAGTTFTASQELDTRFLDTDYIEGEIRRFEEFVATFKEQAPFLHQQQVFAEAQIFDIEHAVEFNVINVCKGYKLYKMLHDARVLRRQCKNALVILSFLEEAVTDSMFKRQISRRTDRFVNRKFAPRALPELFEDGGV